MGRVKDSKVQANATELGEQIRHVDTAQSEPHHLSEKVHHGDQALQILRTHYEPFTPEEERRVLRKIDMRLMPFMLIINGLQFVDKNVSKSFHHTLPKYSGLHFRPNSFHRC